MIVPVSRCKKQVVDLAGDKNPTGGIFFVVESARYIRPKFRFMFALEM